MTNGMRNRAKKTGKKIDDRLAAIENKLLKDTIFDWEAIRPELTDKAEYDRLKKIVNESTQRNETIGQFIDRLKTLGASGAKLLEKAKKLLVA